jgi:multiple sugar transport system permease protein
MRSSSREHREFVKGIAFVSPWLIGFLVFTLTPMALSLYWSFCDYPLTQPAVFRGLENYRVILRQGDFWLSLRNTIYYAVMALPAGMCVSLGLALLLNTKIRGLAIYRTIIFLPSLVPIVASALLWMWIFNAKYGLLNELLGALGINGPNWIADVNTAMPSLALMSLWGVGHTVIIYLAGLQDVPAELYEAAEIDGVTTLSRMWHVTIPMISPVIFFNLIMAIIGTFQVFAVPYMMTQGGPFHATYFYTMYLYENAFQNCSFGFASALAWIQLMIVVGLTAIAFWSSTRWVHYQGK